MSIAKPQMRGMLATLVKRNIALSVTISIIVGAGWYAGVMVPRKQKYADFYK